MAGFLITEHDVFWSCLVDDHGKILLENNIRDDKHDLTNFVRARLVPPDHDYRQSFKDWKFYINQDILPDWYSRAYCETVCRELLPQWFPHHVFIDSNTTLEQAESIFVYGDSRIHINRVTGGRICVYDNAHLEIDSMTDGNIMVRNNSSIFINTMGGGDLEGHEMGYMEINNMLLGYIWQYNNSALTINNQQGGFVNGKEFDKGQ